MPTKHEQFAVLDSDRVDLLCIARDMFTALQGRMAANEMIETVFSCKAEENAYIAAMQLLRKELSEGAGKPRKYRTGRTILDCPQNPPASEGESIRISDLGRIGTSGNAS